MTKLNNEQQKAFISLSVLYPLNEIISKLEKKQYRQNETTFNFLNENLEKFTHLTLKILDIKIKAKLSNTTTDEEFLKHFTFLRNNFQKYIN